ALEVNAKGGDDIVNVAGTDASTRYTINTGEGNDTVNVGVDLTTGVPTNLSGIDGAADTGPLVGRGNGGKDGLNGFDTTAPANIAGTLTPNRVLGLGMRTGIKYLSFEDMHVVLGSGNNQFTVEGTHASQRPIAGISGSGIPRTTTVDAGAGDDTLL